jgi:DnaJ-class molecular chaperone
MAERQPETCMPCRGTGKVISNLGGDQPEIGPRQVACPWCKGGGVRLSSVDAQASWLEGEAAGHEGEEPGDGGEGSAADAVA